MTSPAYDVPAHANEIPAHFIHEIKTIAYDVSDVNLFPPTLVRFLPKKGVNSVPPILLASGRPSFLRARRGERKGKSMQIKSKKEERLYYRDSIRDCSQSNYIGSIQW